MRGKESINCNCYVKLKLPSEATKGWVRQIDKDDVGRCDLPQAHSQIRGNSRRCLAEGTCVEWDRSDSTRQIVITLFTDHGTGGIPVKIDHFRTERFGCGKPQTEWQDG